MATTKISPKRQKSIAAPIQNQPSLVPQGRRRAQSIVPPGASLSPLAKARRSTVAPRKSILKAAINVLNVDASSQSATMQPPPFGREDSNITGAMDLTQDFTEAVRDNTCRKLMGRRVSFASHSIVRMFDKNKNVQSPGSPVQTISNENDYRGQQTRRRRSSVRYSGSEDMDLTTVIPGRVNMRRSVILDEELEYYNYHDEYDGEDMDITQAIHGGFARKRSLSMGGRQPLSLDSRSDDHNGDESHSDAGNDSVQSESVSEQSEQSMAMEFTVPLGQPLRPAEQDPAWLALKQMTHSASEPSEPENEDDTGDVGEMKLEDAMARLRRARDSLPSLHSPQDAGNYRHEDDSSTSTEDDFDSLEDGNKTMNLSQVVGRASLRPRSWMSLGDQGSMDESEIYGNIIASTSRQRLLPQSRLSEAIPKPKTPATVFHSPPPAATKASAPPSQISKQKSTFSAAFAPPVARPSPTSRSSSSPAKRPHRLQHDDAENMDMNQPSPAKRQAMAGKWLEANNTDPQKTATPELPKDGTLKPRPLLPSKKSPFLVSTAPASDSTSLSSSALRRPSGCLAKRKGLAVGFAPTTTVQKAPKNEPKIKPGHGRPSIGSGPSDAWLRSNKEAGSEKSSKPGTSMAQEKEANVRMSEAVRQAIASPSPTRSSRAAAKILSFVEPRLPSPEPQDVEMPDEEETGRQDLSGNIEVDTEATQQWREGVEQAEYEEVPSISVAQFFSMTGIRFMDELTGPRRSLYPSQPPICQPRNPADIPLSEYVTAMAIDIPQLDLYSRVSKDLEGWMAKSKLVFAEVEEEAAKVTPELFVEYAREDEEGRAELLHQLNLIRTHSRFLARSNWYDWKLQWVEGLRVTADEAFASLENDVRALEELKKALADLVPTLEKEYKELMHELNQEKAEVAEIEQSKGFLNELKATMADQYIEVEALKAELTEGNDQLKWLQERLEEIEAQKCEAKSTITTAERILRVKQTSTRAEVFRLKGELETMEDLNMCRITKVQPTLFEYVYSSLFQVTIPCRNFVPSVSRVRITRIGKQNTRYKDDHPHLSAFLLTSAQRLITQGEDMNVCGVVQRLADYWSSCACMRLQFTLLSIKYPLEVSLSGDSTAPFFTVTAMIMFPSVKGKAFVSFRFSFDTFSRWPMSINSLDCDVEVAYGPLEQAQSIYFTKRKI